MATINSSKDVSKAIENILTQLRDKNNCPNLDNSCITKLEAAKKWIDQSASKEAIQVLRNAYKQFAQEVLNGLLNNLIQSKISLDAFLFELIILTLRMDVYQVPEYLEILEKFMKKLPNEQRKGTKANLEKIDKAPNQSPFREVFGKNINPNLFKKCIRNLVNAANRTNT